MESTLSGLLRRGRTFDGEYGERLSSHLPMALISMASLGASDDDLTRFYERYTPRLRHRTPARFMIHAADWHRHLGDSSCFAEFSIFFSSEIARRGREDALRTYLPPLCRGISSCGFHGLIRTSYGIDLEHDDEIADGLALWAAGYRELAREAAPSGKLGDLAVLAELRRRELQRAKPIPPGPIADVMLAIDADREFGRIASSLRVDNGQLARLALIAATAFWRMPDFAALHMVTATHALRLISPFVDDGEFVIAYWIGLAAIYVQIGAPELDLDEGAPSDISHLPDWRVIATRAVASGDDHLIKLVHSCKSEEDFYHLPVYRWLAAREARVADTDY